MRRSFLAIPVALLALALAATAVWAASNTQVFEVTAKPLKLSTKKKPVSITLGVKMKTGSSDGTRASPWRNVHVFFPAGATANASSFPTCDPAKLEASGPSVCPAKSIIGKGSAVVEATPIIDVLNVPITVVNGPKTGGNPQIFFYAFATEPIQVSYVIKGVLKKNKGKWSYDLDVPIQRLQPVSGVQDVVIMDFKVNVGAKIKKNGKTIPYIVSPRKCPKTGFPFAADWTYEDGGTLHKDWTIACP
jgi:hypothetical protein